MPNIVTQLPAEISSLIDIIEKKYVSSGLKYGWQSVKKQYDTGHWNNLILNHSRYFPYDHSEMPYIKYHPELELLWNIIKINLGDKKLLRLYVNGYTYGTDAYSHQDEIWLEPKFGKGATGDTIILYLNKEWNKDWAGETVIFDDNEEIECSILPKYLRVLSFDSLKFHSARPLSRLCPDLRKVLVFKTLGETALHPAIKFLLEVTKDNTHSGKTFFEHLYNVMKILENTEEHIDVAAAGLFHSIYGTEYYNFNHENINREKIKSLIGEYSENLVYEFCNIKDRTNSLINNQNNYNLDFRNDLLKIEYANLKEQNIQGQHNSQLEKIKGIIYGKST